MKAFFKPVLVAAFFLFATSANALMIQISDTADFSGTVVSVDDLDNDGVVILNSGLGSWIFNIAAGFSAPAIGTQHVDKMDLNSVNVTGSAGTIYIRLTDVGFTRDEARYTTAFGGTTDGTISFQSYVDTSNTAFGQGLLVSDSGSISALGFSGQDSGDITWTGPYSMSIYATIRHSGGGQVSSFDYAIAVPEPSSLALIGLGLLGIAAITRRRKTRITP